MATAHLLPTEVAVRECIVYPTLSAAGRSNPPDILPPPRTRNPTLGLLCTECLAVNPRPTGQYCRDRDPGGRFATSSDVAGLAIGHVQRRRWTPIPPRPSRRHISTGDNRRLPGIGGTSTRMTIRRSTASFSATSISSGARKACARPTPACSGRWPDGGCSRWAAAPPRPARWLATQGAWLVALDLSAGMLRHATAAADAHRRRDHRCCRPTRWPCRSATAPSTSLHRVRRDPVRGRLAVR